MALLFFTDASVSKDHPGVPNAQVIKESTSLASKYKGKSCAEQHSIDVAWSTLLEPEYRELRNTICGTPVEVMRFRQLVVNLVMATDGMYALSWFPISCTWRQSHPSRISVVIDKDLKALRDDRWNMAFSPEHDDPYSDDNINRKATIVIEHAIQASDICHTSKLALAIIFFLLLTMTATVQHWHVYRQWNERLFVEMSTAHALGRAQTDPSSFWYVDGDLPQRKANHCFSIVYCLLCAKAPGRDIVSRVLRVSFSRCPPMMMMNLVSHLPSVPPTLESRWRRNWRVATASLALVRRNIW
jgi:3'5'-cyclic nucleotide phosphodiesterase